MKHIKIFVILIIFLVTTQHLFSETISFEDIRANYQVFMNDPSLDNLRAVSEELDIFSEGNFYDSIKSKYPNYKETFEKFNADIKYAMGTFENPWISDSDEKLSVSEVNEISNSFFDFVLQQNIYIADSSARTRMIFISISALVIFTALVSFFILKIIRNKKEALNQSKYILQGQESERKRISEDLHDTIAQNLKAQKLQILNARDNLPAGKEIESEWNELYSNATESLKGIRDICQNLFPPNFANQKMEWILAELCLNTEKKFSVKCANSISADCIVNTYNEENKLHVFRILQEAINNAVAHGKCSEIKISMTKKEIRITDNGSGFDVAETMATKSNHFGLRSITERAKILGGKAVITSGADGTEIVIVL